MRKSFLFLTLFIFLNIALCAQTTNNVVKSVEVENAAYLHGDLTKSLESFIKYPLEALENNIAGDMILSVIINKRGEVDSLNIVNSPDMLLSTASILAFSQLKDDWSPCKINGIPVDKKYLIVFRYRMFKDAQPPKYKERADNLLKKQKYTKALKLYDKAIDENQYNYELFESRAKVKEALADLDGSRTDLIESEKLKNEIISVVNIIAVGVTKVKKISSPFL